MEILVLMILCSVSLAGIFLLVFIYGVKRGQFDEDESPAIRMLNDSLVEEEEQNKNNNKTKKVKTT